MVEAVRKFFAHLLLLFAIASPPAIAQTPPLEKGEKQAIVERAGELLIANYIFPDRAIAAKEKIKIAFAAGSYDEITDAAAFADRLTADLQSVTHDKHMLVTPAPTGAATPASGPLAPPPSFAGFARVDRIKGNIGYIKTMYFPSPGPFNYVADEAMTNLAGTDALIIDMRDNRGGSPDTVAYLCSFFFDPKTTVHLNNLIYRKQGTNEYTTTEYRTRPTTTSFLGKPVYILTSGRTFSGGEEFVNNMKVLKRATIIGETTGGGANPGDVMPLNASLVMFIPTGRAENPITKTNWEGTGIAPDVRVDEKLAFQAAALDIIAKRHGRKGGADLAVLKNQLAQQSDVDPFVEQKLLKIRTTALPNGIAATRRFVEELASGKPNYALMSNDLASAIRMQLPRFQADMSKLGSIQSITFKMVGTQGLDFYDVVMANGGISMAIFVSPEGRIETAIMRPMAPAKPPTG